MGVGDADDGTDFAGGVSDGEGDGGLGVDGAGTGADIAGFVGLEVAGLDGLGAGEREAGHAFAPGDDGSNGEDGRRDVMGGDEEELVALAAVDSAGDATEAGEKSFEPGLGSGVGHERC